MANATMHVWIDLPALQKYDVVSAGMGALTVTSYFVWRGQEPVTALSITLSATVTALVRFSPSRGFSPRLHASLCLHLI